MEHQTQEVCTDSLPGQCMVVTMTMYHPQDTNLEQVTRERTERKWQELPFAQRS
jgi:hypothetical protein